MALRIFSGGEGWGSRGGLGWWCRTWQVFDECNLIWICTWSTTGADGRLLSHSDCCSCSSRFSVFFSPFPLDVLLLRLLFASYRRVHPPPLLLLFTPHTFLYLLLHPSHPRLLPHCQNPSYRWLRTFLVPTSHVNPVFILLLSSSPPISSSPDNTPTVVPPLPGPVPMLLVSAICQAMNNTGPGLALALLASDVESK